MTTTLLKYEHDINTTLTDGEDNFTWWYQLTLEDTRKFLWITKKKIRTRNVKIDFFRKDAYEKMWDGYINEKTDIANKGY